LSDVVCRTSKAGARWDMAPPGKALYVDKKMESPCTAWLGDRGGAPGRGRQTKERNGLFETKPAFGIYSKVARSDGAGDQPGG